MEACCPEGDMIRPVGGDGERGEKKSTRAMAGEDEGRTAPTKTERVKIRTLKSAGCGTRSEVWHCDEKLSAWWGAAQPL